MSEQAKHTEAEYAASAERYGIPCGPWSWSAPEKDWGWEPRFLNDYKGSSVLEPENNGKGLYEADDLRISCDPAIQPLFSTLPDLLIERDKQAEQIRRLREACENSASVFDIVVGTTEKITGATVVHAYAQCVQAAAKCRAALAEGGAA